jgi:hypothetical protein
VGICFIATYLCSDRGGDGESAEEDSDDELTSDDTNEQEEWRGHIGIYYKELLLRAIRTKDHRGGPPPCPLWRARARRSLREGAVGMDSDVWKSELSVFVSAKKVNVDIHIRIRF